MVEVVGFQQNNFFAIFSSNKQFFFCAYAGACAKR